MKKYKMIFTEQEIEVFKGMVVACLLQISPTRPEKPIVEDLGLKIKNAVEVE
jgi:hypothetical protein